MKNNSVKMLLIIPIFNVGGIMNFKGRILVIGCGSVSQCAIPLILKLTGVQPQKVTIIDPVDNRARVKDALDQGVSYIFEKVVANNYKALLSKYAGAGDLILDLGYDIDCCAILQWCHDNKVLYINTSVELWQPYQGAEGKHPTELTLYARQMAMRKVVKSWKDQKG